MKKPIPRGVMFLDKLEKAIAVRLRNNWKAMFPKKTLTAKELENLTSIKLAAVLSWGEVFAQDIRSRKIEAPATCFENEGEYIEWFLDQFDRHEYLKDLKEVKDLFTGELKEE